MNRLKDYYCRECDSRFVEFEENLICPECGYKFKHPFRKGK